MNNIFSKMKKEVWKKVKKKIFNFFFFCLNCI